MFLMLKSTHCLKDTVQLFNQRVCLQDLLTSSRCFDLFRAVIMWWMEIFCWILLSLCLAWTRRGSKSLERLTPPPPQPPSFLISPHQSAWSHSQKLHIASSEGWGLWGGEDEVGGVRGCKNVVRKIKIEEWSAICKNKKSSTLMLMLTRIRKERKGLMAREEQVRPGAPLILQGFSTSTRYIQHFNAGQWRWGHGSPRARESCRHVVTPLMQAQVSGLRRKCVEK